MYLFDVLQVIHKKRVLPFLYQLDVRNSECGSGSASLFVQLCLRFIFFQLNLGKDTSTTRYINRCQRTGGGSPGAAPPVLDGDVVMDFMPLTNTGPVRFSVKSA